MKKSVEKKHGVLRAVISGIITVAVIVCAVILILNWDTAKQQSAVQRLMKISSASDGERFDFEMYSDSVFAELDGGLIVSSYAETSVFDKNGKLIMNMAYGAAEPIISTGGKYAAVWSVEGEEITVFGGGKSTVISAAGPLISVKTGVNGNIVAVTQENGYHGAVNVYKPDATPVYRVYLGTGYPIDAALSQNGNTLAVLMLTDAGSRVAVYSLGSEEEKASCEIDSKVCFDLAYMPGDRLCVMSQQGAVFLDRSANIVNTIDIGGEYLKDYALDRDGCVVFVFGKYKTGSAGRAATFDSYGNELGSLDINSEPGSLSVNGKYIALQYNDSVVIYDRELKEYARLDNANGVKQALVRSDGSAIIVLGGKAAVFEP